MDAKKLLKQIKDASWVHKSGWDKSHPGQKMVSVSTVIKALTNPFDEEEVSKHCAENAKPGTKYCGMTQDDIKAMWAANRQKGMKRGSTLDDYIGYTLKGLHVERCLFDESLFPYFDSFDKWKEQVIDSGYLIYLGSEIWLSCDEGVNGRSDALFYSLKDDAIIIFDWKGDQDYDSNAYGKHLNGPLEILGDTKLNCHTLQVFLYRYMLEKLGFTVKRCYIGHITPDGLEMIPPGFKYVSELIGRTIKWAVDHVKGNA